MHSKSKPSGIIDKLYLSGKQMTEHQVLEAAAEILACKYVREDAFISSLATKDFLRFKLGRYEREVFAVMLLDNQRKLIDYQELFFGTINAASVYPREVVKAVLANNAAAVIFAHNHPSGEMEPSQADLAITKRLTEALALISKEAKFKLKALAKDNKLSISKMLEVLITPLKK